MSFSSLGIRLEELGQDHAGLSMPPTSGVPNHGSLSSSTQNLFVILRCLATEFSPTRSVDELLSTLAALTREAMTMDLCVVMLVDQEHGYFVMRASSPDLNEYDVHVPPLEIDPVLWKKLEQFSIDGTIPVLNIYEQEQINPLKNVQYETLLVVPLLIGTDRLGAVYCYSSKHRNCTTEEVVVLQTITSHACLAIQNRQRVQVPAYEDYVKAFFDELRSGEPKREEALQARASLLGHDLSRPHLVLVVEMVQMHELREQISISSEENQHVAYGHTARLMKRRIQEQYPGSLLDERENMLFCLLPLDKHTSDADVQTWWYDLMHQVQREQHIQMYVGIGNLCREIGDYRRGFAEAEEALRIGKSLNAHSSSIRFNDLGIYRYIYPFACANSLDDPYLRKIAAIVRYDRQRKRSELLDTLETYLALGGNIKDASERLHVHRNTLNQRLKHIESLCSVELDRPENRLQLHIAIMIHKLRAKEAKD